MVPQEVFEALEPFIKLFEASQRSAKKKFFFLFQYKVLKCTGREGLKPKIPFWLISSLKAFCVDLFALLMIFIEAMIFKFTVIKQATNVFTTTGKFYLIQRKTRTLLDSETERHYFKWIETRAKPNQINECSSIVYYRCRTFTNASILTVGVFTISNLRLNHPRLNHQDK